MNDQSTLNQSAAERSLRRFCLLLFLLSSLLLLVQGKTATVATKVRGREIHPGGYGGSQRAHKIRSPLCSSASSVVNSCVTVASLDSGSGVLQSGDARPLITSVAVERELTGGQSHHYQVTAEAGHFVRIVVTQKGLNVVVRVWSPDGKPLWEVDVAGQTEGIEEVSLIAEQAGTYRIEIAPVDKDAGAGRYEAVLTDLRAATQPEQKRWEAEKLSNEAAGLMDQGTKDSFAAAVTKLESAVALNHAADYQVGEIITLLMLSNVHQNLSEYQKALGRLSQALLIARAAGERRYEATILNNLGTVYALLGQPQQRLEVLKQALPLLRAAGDRVTEASCYPISAMRRTISAIFSRRWIILPRRCHCCRPPVNSGSSPLRSTTSARLIATWAKPRRRLNIISRRCRCCGLTETR